MDFKVIDRWLEEAMPEFEKDLAELVSYNSVEAPAEDKAPFGREVAGALESAVSMAEKFGFSVRNEAYYGVADWGDAEGSKDGFMAVLGHLDVVPALPEDWSHDPFEMTAVGDRLYGRGTMDDKGPMLAAIYAAASLKAAGYEPRVPLRFIFGTNEETGMAGVARYVQTESMPLGGFTPDAEWPVVIGEKGICHFTLSADWDEGEGGSLRLVSADSGTAANIVPAKAKAVFEIGEGAELSFPAEDGIETVLDGEQIVISASGVAAHGSTPEQGDNALTKLLRYLARLDFAPAGAKAFLSKLCALTQDDKNGADMGLAGSDEYSVTTVSPNVLHVSGSCGSLLCDMRFRITDEPEKYEKLLAGLAEKEGFTLDAGHVTRPLFVREDSDLVQGLLSAYREVTGDMHEPLIIGGGTYAKVIPGMVAFGCEPIDEPSRAHQADEYAERGELLRAAKVYARAIYNITK